MPSFFLHIFDRGQRLADENGIDVSDLAAARAEAFRVIEELFASGAWARGEDSANYIEIAGASGLVLDTVAVWEVFARPRR